MRFTRYPRENWQTVSHSSSGTSRLRGISSSSAGQLAKAALRIKLTGVIGKESVFNNDSFPCPGGASLQSPPALRPVSGRSRLS